MGPMTPPDFSQPVDQSERILALDVVRGFALFGIFLMNIEWFNRPIAEMSLGLPPLPAGADWWASRLIYVLVQGKFWTIFSLLFGMGFAVMLARARLAGRSFLRLYLRRIAALAAFGAAHFIFLYGGDILFSYALAAAGLLVILYGNWKWMAAALAVLAGLGFLPSLHPLWQAAGSLAYAGVIALFLRGEKRMSVLGRRLPVFSFVYLLLGALAVPAAGLLWAMSVGPREVRIAVTFISLATLAVGFLSARYHLPAELRMRRLAVFLYIFPFLGMTVFGLVQYWLPAPPPVQPVGAARASAPAAPGRGAGTTSAEARKQAEKELERQKEIDQERTKIQTEARVLSSGTYRDVVRFRAGEFPRRAAHEAGFAMLVVSLFLLGAWFVQSGVMEKPGDHLPLFRKLAWIGLPFGVGVGLLGCAIATTHQLGNQHDGYLAASGLLHLGNLPACLGYVSAVVLLLHRGGKFGSWLRFLAPAGRMALTNYILQSVVSSLFFFHYGLGFWGLSRWRQALFVVGVFSAQAVLSGLWLRRFRYGPLEWLWRAFTYWHFPPLRQDGGAARPAIE